MKKLTILSAAFVIVSCGVRSPYDSLKRDSRKAADFCLTLPSPLVYTFMDAESRREMNHVIEGVSRYGLMIFEDQPESGKQLFEKLNALPQYDTYLWVKEDGSVVTVKAFQKNGKVKEVLLLIQDKENTIIINAEGRNIKIDEQMAGTLLAAQ